MTAAAMSYDVITVGGGLGGLLSSALLAKAGKKVLVLEQHTIPGGCCTSYLRQGFTFNVPSVMTALDERASTVLGELGFYDEIRWTKVERFARCVYPDLEVRLPANDLAGCEEVLRRTFPAEGRAIGRFFADVKSVQSALASLGAPRRSAAGLFRLLPSIPRLLRLSRASFDSYMRGTTGNVRLISTLATMWGYSGLPPKRAAAAYILLLAADCYGKPILFPEDGFQAVADFLAGKLTRFGGAIRYGARVERILVEGRRAVGVRVEGGEELRSAAVISNADTRRTLLELVGGANLGRRLAARAQAHTASMSGVSLHLGTDLDLTKHDLKYAVLFVHESDEDDDRFYDRALNNQICFDRDAISFGMQAPSLFSNRLAPPGAHILHVLVAPVSRAYMNGWNRVEGRHGADYRRTKKELADALVRKVERLVPGLARSIRVSELATPFTFERYTGASGGAWYDGVMPAGASPGGPMIATGLAGLYFTGTKAFGGAGMPSALLGGVLTARKLLGAR